MNSKPALDLTDAQARDRSHPLRDFRERFHISDPDVIYLDGNSLGRLPKAARNRVEHVVSHEWGDRLIRSWGESWFDASERLGEKLAPLIGVASGQVIFSDSTSVNLYKLVLAALEARAPRKKIVTDELNFPSDLYILEGAVRLWGRGAIVNVVPAMPDGICANVDAIINAIDHDTALVTLSHVAFKSGFLYDAVRITEAAHAKGALVLWDLSHSVGAVPVDLDGWRADLAVGCSYKYLNGGPGAPAFLYVRKDLQDRLTSPIWGWFGRDRPFSFDLSYTPVAGMRRFTVGTPPVLSLLGLEPGLDVFAEAGMEKISQASVALTSYLIELIDERLAPRGFTLASPRDSALRGSHVTIAHEDAYRIATAMVDRGVIPDFREPNGIRLGIAPLYVSHEDIWVGVDRITKIIDQRLQEQYPKERSAVT